MASIRKSVFVTVATQYSTELITLVFTLILARLISPAELGVYAIASSIAALAMNVQSMGVGEYLVREERIDNDKIRSAIGLMVLICGSLGTLLFITAPALGVFYEQPALSDLLRILSIAFVFAPFTAIPNALIAREMMFEKILVARVVSALVVATSTLGLVVAGYSYYGLAIGLVLGSFTTFCIFNYFSPPGTPWLPQIGRAHV